MKSPFVRFSRFVRSPLSIATVGLCTLWGCRQMPGSRHSRDDHQESVSSVDSNDAATRRFFEYEEPNFANPINPDASERPLVSLSESDTSQLVPPEIPEAISSESASAPEVATVTTAEPMPLAESPEFETPIEFDETAEPAPKRAALSNSRTDELRESPLKLEPPKLQTPAPTPNEFEDDFFPDVPEAPPKLEVPPEPAPQTKEDTQPAAKPQAKSHPRAATQELASIETKRAAQTLKPVPKPEPVREKHTVPKVDNEVLSLDSYCDGLVFDSQGFGYVSHRNQIVKFSPTGQTSVWTTLSNPKGHRIEPEGTHLICDVERHEVVRLSYDGKVVGVAAKTCDGAPLCAPCDIAVDPNGGFYFTDPGYVQIKNPIGKVYHVDRNGQISVMVAKLGYPTGIVLDPNRQRVLVAESNFNRIVAFRLSEPGRVESHEVLVQLPKSPDREFHLASLCLDSTGNLYVTQPESKSVQVFDPQGRPLGRFSTGTVTPSSIALRPTDVTELFFSGELETSARNGKVIRLNLGK